MIELLNEMFDPVAVTGPVNETAPIIAIAALLVVKFPFRTIAPVYSIAPVVTTEELCVIVVPLTVKELKPVVPPTAPDSPTVPLAEMVSACAPLMVLLNERFDPVAVTGPVNTTAPVIPMVLPVAVTLLAKLIVVAV